MRGVVVGSLLASFIGILFFILFSPILESKQHISGMPPEPRPPEIEKKSDVFASKRDACEQYHQQAIDTAARATGGMVQAYATKSIAFSMIYRDCVANIEKAKLQ